MGQPPAPQPPQQPVPPPPPAAPVYAAAPQAGYPAQKWNGLAITGFIMSFFCGGILGVIFSAIALAQINKQPTLYKGKGLAIAGLVIGVCLMALWIILLATGAFTAGFQTS